MKFFGKIEYCVDLSWSRYLDCRLPLCWSRHSKCQLPLCWSRHPNCRLPIKIRQTWRTVPNWIEVGSSIVDFHCVEVGILVANFNCVKVSTSNANFISHFVFSVLWVTSTLLVPTSLYTMHSNFYFQFWIYCTWHGFMLTFNIY